MQARERAHAAEEKEENVTNFTHAVTSKNDLYANTAFLFTILGDL